MTVFIRKCTISEMESASNIAELLDEYAGESAITGLPHPSVRVETYKYLETVNAIYAIGAFIDELLIGFLVVLSPILPHYSVKVAVGESFFVSKSYRKTGAGLKLLNAAEHYAKDIGACGLLVSAPIGGNLAEVLPHVGYTETNRVFFRNFNND